MDGSKSGGAMLQDSDHSFFVSGHSDLDVDEVEGLLGDSRQNPTHDTDKKRADKQMEASDVQSTWNPWRIWREKVSQHGVGVVLYFEFSMLAIVLLFTGLVPYLVSFLLFTEHRGGSSSSWIRDTPDVYGACGVAGIVLLFALLFRVRQRRIWSKAIVEYPTVTKRSVLVSCSSFRGSVSLVPTGADLATFFSENYGPVENVLLLLDIGKQVQLRRMRSELKRLMMQSQLDTNQYRPRQGYLSTMICCRTCRKMARKAGEKQMDRYQRWLDRVDDKLGSEEDLHQVECLGCAIITFEKEEDARALLRDNIHGGDLFTPPPGVDATDRSNHIRSGGGYLTDDDEDDIIHDFSHLMNHQVEETSTVLGGACCKKQQHQKGACSAMDHAKDWWFPPSFQSITRFGEDLQPMFVRLAPEPDDVDFESLVHGVEFSSLSSIRLSALVFFGFITICIGGMMVYPSILTLNEEGVLFIFPFAFRFFVLVGGSLLIYAALYFGGSSYTMLPNRYFTTFSLSQRNKFQCAMLFVGLYLSGFGTFALVAEGLDKPPKETFLRLLYQVLIMYQCFGIVFASVTRQTWSDSLGFKNAEIFTSIYLTLLLSPWIPVVLVSSIVLVTIKYYAEKVRIIHVFHDKVITPRLGPDVAVSLLHHIPLMSTVMLLCPLIALGVNGGKMTSDLAFIVGGISFILSLGFNAVWMYIANHYPHAFKHPILPELPHMPSNSHAIRRSPSSSSPGRDLHTNKAEVRISFGGSDTNAWGAGRFTSTSNSSEQIGYRLPDFDVGSQRFDDTKRKQVL